MNSDKPIIDYQPPGQNQPALNPYRSPASGACFWLGLIGIIFWPMGVLAILAGSITFLRKGTKPASDIIFAGIGIALSVLGFVLSIWVLPYL